MVDSLTSPRKDKNVALRHRQTVVIYHGLDAGSVSSAISAVIHVSEIPCCHVIAQTLIYTVGL